MVTATAPTSHQTVRAPRLPLLDVLRGVAILGTLATNIWIFADPHAEAAVLLDNAVSARQDSVAETLLRFLANGKFLSLLTVLFGVGLAIQFAAASKRGKPWPGRYYWRALFLLAEGLLHFILIFAFDVLMGYALAGLLVARLLSRSRRVQTIAMWTAGVWHLVSVLLITVAMAFAPATGATRRGPGDLYTGGSWIDQVGYRLDHALMFRLEMIFSFGMVVFLFFLGVRLFRAGAFSADDNGRRLRRRMLLWGMGLGLPANLATTLAGPDLVLVDRYVMAPLLAIGYIGAIGVLLDYVRPGRGAAALSALGRTALSGYVTQNLVCCLLFYGFGLGLAARLDGQSPWWTIGVWALLSVLLVSAATLCLRRFGAGPLEALQKRLLRG